VEGEIFPRGEPRPIHISPEEAEERHEQIYHNVVGVLKQNLENRPFFVVESGIVGGVEGDFVVVKEQQKSHKWMSPVPITVVQILSPYSEGDDRGWKFVYSRRKASLVDYVMISQEKPFVEHYSRQDQELWGIRDLEGFTAILRLPSLGCELPLAKIYERVAFPKQSRLPGEQEQL
jgi:hypothetical protein